MTDEQWREYEKEIRVLLELWFKYYVWIAVFRSSTAIRLIPEHKIFCSLYQLLDQGDRSERGVETIREKINLLTHCLIY